MNKRKFLILVALVVAALSWGIDQRAAEALDVGPNGYYIPDYFLTPNWANSPALTKFVDSLAPLGCTTPNNLGQCIPIAVPDTTTYPGSDYYEIELVEYRERMHTAFPALNNADKMLATTGGTKLRGYRQINHPSGPQAPQYLGPLIIAQKDRPVRIKFKNSLPTGVAGNLFIPVDTTIMGSGDFEINYDPATKATIPTVTGTFAQNRATLHLHGGRTPWISDGTPHQWITPAGETTSYPKGVSVAYVPDMWFDASGNTIGACAGQTTCATPGATNNPGSGAQTFYYTNQQSARLMFYHDHSWGITRLNVYVGEAAGYLLQDPVELAMINGGTVNGRTYSAGTIPADQIPLVIQDKTFVDATTIMTTDPTWAWGSNPGKPVTPAPVTGDLWWPHVYMPAQNPYNPNMSGINDMGRWHYGPWFYPSTPVCGSSPQAVKPFCIDIGPVANPYANPANPNYSPLQPPEMPGTPTPSWGAEAFLDTMLVNGTVYPTIEVQAQAYRFRILNAAHDRFLNLQLYRAANKNFPTTPGGGPPVFTGPVPALTEVAMVPAAFTPGFPATWPTDGREGGVPDPATRGPAFIQIGSEGGLLPAPVVLPNQPVAWNLDPTMFNVGNVLQQNQGGGTLFLGPAERADVIVDFSQYAGQTLILYNDAPTAFPALDPHYDYYTGAPDRTDIGGATAILPGFGPNIRTVMQIHVAGSGGTAPPDYYNVTTLGNLQTAFASGATPGAFESSQNPIIVGQTAYNSTYNTTFPATWPNWGVSRISDTAISFQKVDGTMVSNFAMKPKAIHDEMGATFDDYGRMSAKLGLEVPFVNAAIANFILQNYVDPPTELFANGQVQIWKITHNGVDTHPIHFHLFEVQVINRVGWDGFIRLPDPNELGWKDTLRVSPLEDTIVAIRLALPQVPFRLPNSVRPLNPQTPLGSMMGFSQIDTTTGGALTTPTTNRLNNFGHEYVWHCHILSHEENDMMRPIVVNINAQTEILWRNTSTGDHAIWIMDGVTTTGVAIPPPLANISLEIVGRGDFNGDGKPDILWRDTSTGFNYVWFMDGATFIGWAELPPLPNTVLQIVGVGDFNGDGKPDILWRDASMGSNYVWFMSGATFIGWAELSPLPDTAWTVAAVRDFNNDANPDILWRNTTTGQNTVWYMSGVTFAGWADFPAEADQNWQIVGSGDFNNDVTPDLLWRNGSTGENRVWYMDGVTLTGSASLWTVPDTNWKIVGD